MLYQYHCACCNQVVASAETSCPQCGSHQIRSPYGFWLWCIVASIIIVAAVQLFSFSNQTAKDPEQPRSWVYLLK